MVDNKYSPELICTNNSKIYNIPIYQRLFAWTKENIEQLLNDMKSQYEKDKESPYYIGMLTMHKNDLVDGQQRFTVLSIIASVFKDYYEDWSLMNGKLHLSARPTDEQYLLSLYEDKHDETVINKKMADGQELIKSWLVENITENSRSAFCEYVYKNCTFFIATLPDTYEAKDLNKYFEAMNSTGRNLEAHEIIKVEKYLKSMSSEQDFYNSIWNLVSDMDKALLRKRTEGKQKETEEDFRNRYLESIYNFDQNISNKKIFNLLNDFSVSEEKYKNKNIRELKADGHNPDVRRQDKYYGEGYHSMLIFPEFLLQNLYLMLNSDEREKVNVNDFFDIHKIQETFSNFTEDWNEYEWKKFGKELLRYRLIFDYYVIRIPNSEIANYDLNYSEAITTNDKVESTVIAQLQSLLYVDSSSKTYYRWVVPFLEYLKDKKKITSNEIFKKLQSIDNGIDEHAEKFLADESSFSFGGRRTVYFLRRLDFYLWLKNHNSKNTTDKSYSIIEKFKFKRSINSQEHLHPQNDENRTGYKDWGEQKNKFGNLFLISSSFNSTQSDDTINTKFGRIKDQIQFGTIESIKLYKIYQLCNNGKDEEKWDLKTMNNHQNEMILFLKDTYK